MENDNTGLGLIVATIERVKGKNGELFTSALKKLNNSTEVELKLFINSAKILAGKAWKSIYIGGKSADKLMKELADKNFKPTGYAKSMTAHKQFSTSAKSKKVDFAKKSPKEFGFTGTTFVELLQFFRNHQIFELCQPEDAYYLRMVYNNQPEGDGVRLAMETISDSGGDPRVFDLRHDLDGMLLSGYRYDPLEWVHPDYLWVARIRE